MLGADTLILTTKGFVRVKDLSLYDRVCTAYGTFEPVIGLGPVKKVNLKLTLSTGEKIYCSDDLLCWSGTTADVLSLRYADMMLDRAFATTLPIVGCKKNTKGLDFYRIGLNVPREIDSKWLAFDMTSRLSLLGGIIDSPMTVLSYRKDGYIFIMHSKRFKESFIAFLRSLGYQAFVSKRKFGPPLVVACITHKLYKIPIKDNLKRRIFDKSAMIDRAKVEKIEVLEEDKEVYGREVKVNGHSLLIGYSLIPVQG